jgi:hypothetical protein
MDVNKIPKYKVKQSFAVLMHATAFRTGCTRASN